MNLILIEMILGRPSYNFVKKSNITKFEQYLENYKIFSQQI